MNEIYERIKEALYSLPSFSQIIDNFLSVKQTILDNFAEIVIKKQSHHDAVVVIYKCKGRVISTILNNIYTYHHFIENTLYKTILEDYLGEEGILW